MAHEATTATKRAFETVTRGVTFFLFRNDFTTSVWSRPQSGPLWAPPTGVGLRLCAGESEAVRVDTPADAPRATCSAKDRAAQSGLLGGDCESAPDARP
jgi:hypothetical protein